MTIKLVNLIGSEARSRSTAAVLSKRLVSNENVEVDLSEITFMSRSFADELCDLLEHNHNLSVVNATGIARKMLDVVREGRNKKRNIEKDNSEIIKVNNMKELSEFFATF